MNSDPLQEQSESGVGVIPAPPAKLAAYRPEAWTGFHMRWEKWDRLKKQLRDIGFGDTNWWKEAAVLFYGTALGNLPSIVAQIAKGPPFIPNISVFICAGALIAGIVCSFGYVSVGRRDRVSVRALIDTMDEVEAEFTRQSQ